MSSKGPFIWETHEYLFQEKSTDWYWAVCIVGVSIAVLSLIFGNFLFSLLIFFSTFALALFASKPPSVIKFEVSKKGVQIDKTLYPFATLESFWVEDNRHHNHQSKLIIKSQRAVVPLIAIPLDGVDPEEMRDYLLDHLLEDHHPEPFGQKLLEYFGF